MFHLCLKDTLTGLDIPITKGLQFCKYTLVSTDQIKASDKKLALACASSD